MDINLPGAYNGFSTQPDHLRSPTQCEFSRNILHSLTSGDQGRPGAQLKFSLSRALVTTSFFAHKIERDETEKYFIFADGDATEPLLIYTKDGTKCTVTYEDSVAKGYVASTSLKAITVADTTFVTNKGITAAMTSGGYLNQYPAAYFIVKKSLPTYGIVFRGSISYRGSSSVITFATSADTSQDTGTLASNLAVALNALVSGWAAPFNLLQFTASGNVVRVNWVVTVGTTSYPAIYVKLSDSQGNSSSSYISSEQFSGKTFSDGTNTFDRAVGLAQKYTDLPYEMPNSEVYTNVIKIKNETLADDGYYVKYDSGKNIWVETVAPGLNYIINYQTFPKKIVRTALNTFHVSHIRPTDREVGDDNSNPEPSFIGNSIDDIFFFRDRLGLISKTNVVMSRAGVYENFWATTATEVLDDDPIDISVSATAQVSDIKAVVDFNEGLLLFSDEEQYILTSGQQPLTPKTVTVGLSTRFKYDTTVKPVLSGPNCFFLDGQKHLREYYVAPDSLINDAEDISSHISEALKGSTVSQLTTIPQLNMVVIRGSFKDKTTGTTKQGLLVYKFLWQGQEKVQSAWVLWEFRTAVNYAEAIGTDLYLMFNSRVISYIDLSERQYVISDVMLDKYQKVLTGTYNSGTDRTTYTLTNTVAYTGESSANAVAYLGSSYRKVPIVSTDFSSVVIGGNHATTPLCFGIKRDVLLRLSRVYAKGSNGISLLNGKVLLKRFKVRYRDSAEFNIEVTPIHRTKVISKWTSTTVNHSILGYPSCESGEYGIMVLGDNKGMIIDVVSDSHLPVAFEGYTFRGDYIQDRGI